MTTLIYEEQLRKIFDNVNDWLKFAETKNFGLLSLCAAIIFGATQINFSDNSVVEKAGTYTFLPLATFSFLVALLSVFPIVSSIDKGQYLKSWINSFSNFIDEEVTFENIHFYGYLRSINENEFEVAFLTKANMTSPISPFTIYEKELVSQILYNARITWLKFQLFKIGAFLFLLGIVFFIVAYIFITIFK